MTEEQYLCTWACLSAALLRIDYKGTLMEAGDEFGTVREPTVPGTSVEAAGVKEAVGSGCEVKAEPTTFANRLERHVAESRRLP